MKTPIFKVVKRPRTIEQDAQNINAHNSNSSEFSISNDEIYHPQTQPFQNDEVKKVDPKCNLFITEHTNLETKTTESSIWKNCEKNPYNILETILYLKKEFIGFLIMYINGILDLYDIKEKLIPIYDEIINNTDKDFNIKLLNSTLKDIFSVGMNTKEGQKRNLNHNIKLIKKIYDKNYLRIMNILNKTFLECLEHFRRTKYIPELQGFEFYFFMIIGKLEMEHKDKDFIRYFVNITNEYEYIYFPEKESKNNVIIKEDN